MGAPTGWAVAAVVLLAACSAGDDDASSTATTAPVDDVAVDASVRVVSQNLLHGIACAADSDGCDLPGRVLLFLRQLQEGGCPELVSLQEANERTVGLVRQGLVGTCDGAYEVVWDGDPSLDREVVLTTLPVLGSARTRLAGPLRTALWVRVAADVGVVDFVSTHLASSSDDRPCDATTCPPPCAVDETVNACQGREVAAFAAEVAADDSVVVLAGDLNAQPGDPAIDAILAAGFVDTHLAAGNAECDTATGEQCTSGRVDDALTDLTDPTSRQGERIDYVFVGGPRDCSTAVPTGLFNGDPADPAVDGLVFPSDHTGVEATLSCATTDAQRAAAPDATVTTAPPTTVAPGAEVDPEVAAGIADAFHLLFDGDVTDVEAKLAALEDGELLRAYFLDSYEAQASIASRVRVRIDEVRLVDAAHADVTYTLLLDGTAVLDHLPGGAVEIAGRWLVTRRTYCDVSTQGATEIPPPCQ